MAGKNLMLYHGSSVAVGNPVWGLGNPKNDYGLGFYCTPHKELACEWACSEIAGGYVNSYRLHLAGLSVLNLTSGDYTILHWLAVLLRNRTFRLSGDVVPLARDYLLQTFSVPVEEYDVVRGYRADDSYFSFADAFLKGAISLPQLERAMTLGNLGEQVVPRSERAFEQLEFLGADAVDQGVYYPRRKARDRAAREAFAKERFCAAVLAEPRIFDILREEWSEDDARLQRMVLR